MKHHIALVLILLAVGVANLALREAQDAVVRENPVQQVINLPAEIGKFRQSGPDLEVDERTRRILSGATILMRRYVAPNGWPIVLTIVHTGQSRENLHQPEVCLVGHGWEVSKRYSEPVGFSFPGKRLVLDRGNQQEAVLYWYKTGDKFTDSAFTNALFWAQRQFSFQVPMSTIIKLSTPIGKEGEEHAYRILTEMALRLAPELKEHIQ